MDRTATAHWEGDLRSGNGRVALGSGAFEGKYSFGTRFEGAPGTNPEELLGAAHAGCFTMALSLMLSQAGHVPTRLDTKATVHLNQVTGGFAITGCDLVVEGVVPGISAEEFVKHAENAKANCLVSKVLTNMTITVKATLVA